MQGIISSFCFFHTVGTACMCSAHLAIGVHCMVNEGVVTRDKTELYCSLGKPDSLLLLYTSPKPPVPCLRPGPSPSPWYED